MLTVLIGLTAALVYGSADFIGGIASKRISPIRVTAIGAASGLVILFVAQAIVGGRWSWEAMLYGGISGITGAIAITLLYACLAIGPMSILSPLTALVSAFVPLMAGVIRGERLPVFGYVAIGIALVAVVLVGFVKEEGAVRPSLRALLMAIGSGAMIGAFLILIDLTPDDAGVVPLIANRAVNGVVMFAVIGVLALALRRRDRSPASSPSGTVGMLSRGWKAGFWLAVVGGMIDATANALLLVGLRLGNLSVISVLTALYPAGTIILAAVVLRERIAPVQVVGLVLALIAAAMLALA
ncbi:drug/metabolite transporter (DMT)-like permease [Cryobacterium mesophilum]|uniref:DMT family transporter n=1 Tax=Terrimesophilobacter mesophilus TaxID=433647 RepID=A0A4R8VCZ7_9MICO|nr:DMT family transporter [Terrimesophilobacter mesophilus]MBB5633267.1 drug/metabolite transporter (DMT)-like permease [Terrimesophilobacter mesophilus]TFB80010.1 DMT family transporter [Terrimesophilobacter mesophilus]